MKLENILLSALLGIGAATAASIDNSVCASSPKDKVPRLNPDIASSINPDYKQGLKDDPNGKEKLHVDGTITLTYTGVETVRGPFNVQYSVCFGPPAEEDDVKPFCATGGRLGGIDSLISGSTTTFEIQAKSWGNTAPYKDDKKGNRTMRGLTPHITVIISDSSGEEVYQEHILLKPIEDY